MKTYSEAQIKFANDIKSRWEREAKNLTIPETIVREGQQINSLFAALNCEVDEVTPSQHKATMSVIDQLQDLDVETTLFYKDSGVGFMLKEIIRALIARDGKYITVIESKLLASISEDDLKEALPVLKETH